MEEAPWARVTIDGRVVLTVAGPGAPDLETVDVLARVRLAMLGRGAEVSVECLCPRLRELVELCGLREVFG